jgi:hypothetical protein
VTDVEWLLHMCELENENGFPGVSGAARHMCKLGKVAERTIAPVLKTGGPSGPEGSNPSLPAEDEVEQKDQLAMWEMHDALLIYD